MKHLLSVMLLSVLLMLAACAPQASAPTDTTQATNAPVLVSGKPQFLNSYATWCTTCRRNAPLLSALEARFGEKIAFVTLDVDNPATRPIRDKFGLVDRSMYALIAPDGETVLARWFGVLNEQEVTTRLTEFVQSGQ